MIRVQVRPNEPLESALRRFKRQCNYAGIFRTAKKYSFFEKRSDKRRRESRERIRNIQRAMRKAQGRDRGLRSSKGKPRKPRSEDGDDATTDNKAATPAAASAKAPAPAVAANPTPERAVLKVADSAPARAADSTTEA